MPFQLSPGVLVVEKDLTSIIPAVATSTGAFAGTFVWGPVMEPTLISSENQLVARFGGPTDNNATSFFTAANFLSYTNALWIARADTTGNLNAVAIQTGSVADTSIADGGADYEEAYVAFGAPDQEGGVQATGTAVLDAGVLIDINITEPGSGYSSAPTITITSAASVASLTVVGGTGYTTVPTVSVSAPQVAGGTTAVISLALNGDAVEATLVDGGSGYTAAPTVTLTGGGGTSAAVTAVLNTLGSGADVTAIIATAGVKINNEDVYLNQYVNGAGVVGEWAAKYPGALGNSLKVSIVDSSCFAGWDWEGEFDSSPGTSDYAQAAGGSNDEVHIIVIDEDGAWTGTRNAILEKFAFASKASDARKADGTNNYYRDVVNTNSKYIWWMDHPLAGNDWGSSASAGGAFDNLGSEVTRSLGGGVTDNGAADGDLTNAWDLFANAELYDISLLPVGGVTPGVAKFVVEEVAETRRDCVVFVSPVTSGGAMIQGATIATDTVAFRNDSSFNVSSSYAVLDSGWKYQYDRYNDKYRWIPLNGDIAGLCARTDYTNDAWWSPGGLNRGQIKNIVKLSFNPNQTERDELYKAGVNPVVTFPGQGTVLFGDKTLLAKPSAFDRINVRRLFIVLEKAIATAAKFQLFEFNDAFTRAQFRSLVEPFLRDVQGRRGVIDFRVKCDETNNTGEVIDRNEFIADIFIKPNRSINFITLNFVAARTGISFDEIGG